MKHIFFLTVLICFCIYSGAQTTADIIIKNGRILDGTGNSWVKGDIAIKNGHHFCKNY
jgi:N-acyl-D-amino-acid deacylase